MLQYRLGEYDQALERLSVGIDEDKLDHEFLLLGPPFLCMTLFRVGRAEEAVAELEWTRWQRAEFSERQREDSEDLMDEADAV